MQRKGIETFVLLIGKIIIAGMALFGISTIFFNMVATSAPNADKNFLNQTFRYDTQDVCNLVNSKGKQQSVSKPVVFDGFAVSGEMEKIVFKEQAQISKQGQSSATRTGALFNASWKNGDWMLSEISTCDAWGKIIVGSKELMGVSDTEGTLQIDSGANSLKPNTDYDVRREPYVTASGDVMLNLTFVEVGSSGP